MTVGRNAGGHFFRKGNQRKAIMVYLAVALSAALGGFVQSITGFGAAVVMMTILPYFFTMAVAPSVSTSICLGLTVTLAWKLRKSIDLKLTLPPTLLYAAASVTAIRFIGSMDLRVMTMVFGAFLMLLGAYLLLTEKKAAIRVTPVVTVVCGLLAGVCGGLFSIGGPIMAIYYLAATDSRESYLANAQANFAVNNVTSITTRVLSGYYTLDLLPLTLLGETVVLLSKGEIDSKKVRVEFSLEDMDMSGFQKGATYEQIKAYVLEHTGLKVSSLYISQIKRKCGLDVGQNYNLSKKEDAKVPKCPPEKEAAIRDALKYFQMI